MFPAVLENVEGVALKVSEMDTAVAHIVTAHKPEIAVAQQVSIRDAGFNEYWLQDQIYDNPVCLGLGELEVVQKERVQNPGGRLDILLKDTEDDSMYEVEVMLGETDETHIIRTIEYWDNEKRRWPKRQQLCYSCSRTH